MLLYSLSATRDTHHGEIKWCVFLSEWKSHLAKKFTSDLPNLPDIWLWQGLLVTSSVKLPVAILVFTLLLSKMECLHPRGTLKTRWQTGLGHGIQPLNTFSLLQGRQPVYLPLPHVFVVVTHPHGLCCREFREKKLQWTNSKKLLNAKQFFVYSCNCRFGLSNRFDPEFPQGLAAKVMLLKKMKCHCEIFFHETLDSR